MMPATTPRIAAVLVMAAAALCASASYAGVPSDNWKTECVGRMQINLPDEAEVAATLTNDFVRDVSGKGSSPIKFEDGQSASWSVFSFSGVLLISHSTKDENASAIRAAIQNQWQEVNLPGNSSPAPSALKKNRLVHLAWKGGSYLGSYLRAYMFIDQTAIRWGVGADDKDLPDYEKAYEKLIDNLRPRPLFDVPREPGVCLPYLFVRDDGQTPRHIGMTYRLKAHPDITVWLEDASAARLGERQNPEKLTALYKAAFFWNQRYQNYRSIESQWPLRRTFKDTLLAGLPGVKTFVKLTRDDKERTEDYGYLAAVRGNPDASEDHPDLMLYVIQDSINATRRGIAPLTKQEFIDIAEKIAASVRRREVKNSRKHDSQQSLSSDV
jgi:hypothetical protein